MQATHYVPDEIDQVHGRREECSLKADNDFAAEVLGEKQKLMPQELKQQARSVVHDLFVYISDRQWIFIVWSLEVFWIAFIVTSCSMEMWGSCPFEMGMAPVCQYCMSTTFLTWLWALVVLWTFTLYTYVLLTSRGFSFKLRYLGLTVVQNNMKGIPAKAIYLFLFLSSTYILWLILGIVILLRSENCTFGGVLYGNRPGRSVLMFWTTLLSVLIAPVLLFFGRCDDAKDLIEALFYD
mmetsp:Transcript_31927/g.56328  ORF Transcript_31927/g.56328 Transcript_31927/m.56328 type:complete len:238 (-) Transcript_31927:96-809(-)